MRRPVVLMSIMFAGFCGLAALELLRAFAVGSNARVISTAEAISAEEALGAVRRNGFTPTSGVMRRGGVYVADALGGKGQKLRLVVDARTGDVIGAGRQPDNPAPEQTVGHGNRTLGFR